MAKALYAINQCALYKIGSKARLAKVLGCSVSALLGLTNKRPYREFELAEETCPFTGKITKARWVQEPLGLLRNFQERIRKLLMRVTPPGYAHAAVKGRSYRSNALHHANAACVGTFDIRKFYPSTTSDAVYSFFLDQLKCAPDIASLLTKLVTFQSASSKFGSLPTGSPLSPILSIYANKPMFDSLEKLAKEFRLEFSCYVDDLTFSGDVLPSGLEKLVKKIVERFGHNMAEHKTKIFQSHSAKHITGVVVKNGKVHVPFSRFRKARAIEATLLKEVDLSIKLDLSQRLAGLLGEAAFLDERFQVWARSSYRQLAAARVLVKVPEDLVVQKKKNLKRRVLKS